MAVFKTCVQSFRLDGYGVVYIIVTNKRSVAFIKTDLLLKHEMFRNSQISDPFINKECAIRISEYTDKCNRINVSEWSAKEIVDYLTKNVVVPTFSDYCKIFTDKMDNENRETTSENYKLAIARLEEFSNKKPLRFSDITSSLINLWIESMMNLKYTKHAYPKTIRTMFQHGCDEYNDYDHDIIRITNQPFKKVKIPRPKAPQKRAVSIETLNKFFATDIDSFLDHSLNATEMALGINSALHGDERYK